MSTLYSVRLNQGFFSALAQKLKDEKTQTQGKFYQNSRKFSLENSRNRQIGANLGQILIKNSNFNPKSAIFDKKLETFKETQGFLLNSSPKSLKNSRNRQFKKSYRAQKTAKNKPCTRLASNA